MVGDGVAPCATLQVASVLDDGGVDPRLLYGPVLMLQYAIQFIQLAVPSSVARVALEIRFFERQGTETGGALSIGLIDRVSGLLIRCC